MQENFTKKLMEEREKNVKCMLFNLNINKNNWKYFKAIIVFLRFIQNVKNLPFFIVCCI